MSEWISVKDRLPPKGESVLMYITYISLDMELTECIVAWIDNNENLITEGGDEIGWPSEVITHWMPLPEPPIYMKDFITKAAKG